MASDRPSWSHSSLFGACQQAQRDDALEAVRREDGCAIHLGLGLDDGHDAARRAMRRHRPCCLTSVLA